MTASRYSLGLRRRRSRVARRGEVMVVSADEVKIFVDVTARALMISPEVARALLARVSMRDIIDVVHRQQRLSSIFSSMGAFGAVMGVCHAEATLQKMLTG